VSDQATLEMNEETALLSRIAAGDVAALCQFRSRLLPRLRSAAHQVLHHSVDAQEVAEEVFMKVWQRAEAFDQTRGSPYAWAVTIVRRRAVDRLRRRVRQAHLMDAYSATNSHAGMEPGSQFDGLLDADDRQVIRCAIESLSPPLRTTLKLFYFEGLTQEQIAARTAAPLGTVKGRIRQSVIRLRNLLRQTGFTDEFRPVEDPNSAGGDGCPLAS
jgi:RNA polymerase sigma-70 factor (ECF subfamily)